MFSFYLTLLSALNIKAIIIIAIFFFIGYGLAPLVYHRKIKLFTAYPLWVHTKIEKLLKKKWPPLIMFLLLFITNCFSLYLCLVSGFALGLPVVFSVWMGLNIGIVAFHTLKGHFFFSSLVNPVALFELPATFITLSMAWIFNLHKFNITFGGAWFSHAFSFSLYQQVFLYIILPLLLIAAIFEVAMLVLTQKLENKKEDFWDK